MGERTAFNCSRYHVHDGKSAFSKHLVNSAIRVSPVYTGYSNKPTLGLRFAADALGLVGLLLHRNGLCRCLRGRGSLGTTAKEHVGDTVSNSRADSDRASSGSHLREHTGLTRASL